MATLDRRGTLVYDVAVKTPVLVATTGSNIALTGVQTIDGVSVGNAGERVLVKDQTDQTQNGIYAAATGVWTRTTDASSNGDFINGSLVLAAQGTANAGLQFVQTCADSPIVFGTSLIVFVTQSTVASAQQTATSTTSFAIGTGSKAFATQAGKNFSVNQWVLIQETSNSANQMLGQITAYSGTTLTVSVTATGGSGTHADWTIVLTNSSAAAGMQPPVGLGNVTGPGSATAGHFATFADSTGKVIQDGGASITYSQIQNETTNTLLGNVSGGAAAPAEIPLGAGLIIKGGNLVSAVPVAGLFKNLSIKVASNTTVAVAADSVVVTDGTNFQAVAISATCNLGSNGAVNQLDTAALVIDAWYAIWAIAKADGTAGTLASLSFSAPALPSGYTYKARIGAVQTVHATATLYGTWQFGRRAQYVVGLAQTTVRLLVMANGTAGTASGTSPTLTAVTVQGNGKWVPTTASAINVLIDVAYNGNAAASIVQAAPSTAWGGTNNGPGGTSGGPWPMYGGASPTGTMMNAWMLLESIAIAWASSGAGGAISCFGWEDNI